MGISYQFGWIERAFPGISPAEPLYEDELYALAVVASSRNLSVVASHISNGEC